MDLDKESKKFIEAVFTIGDNGGYRIFEWFKLFPKERELAEKEYVYLKAHLARQAYVDAGKNITKEMYSIIVIPSNSGNSITNVFRSNWYLNGLTSRDTAKSKR